MKQEVTIIIGDSWGCGEWTGPVGPEYNTTHPGLAGYLIDHGENVINLSVPGGSLNDSYQALDRFIFANHHNKTVTKVYCVQTSVFRDFTNNFYMLDDKEIKSFDDFVYCVLLDFYRELGKISHLRGNFPIYIVGGLSDAPVKSFFDTFSNIHLACQSWANLCVNSNPSAEQINTWDYVSETLIDYLVKEKNVDKQDVLENLSRYRQREKLLQDNPEYFFPDGVHANKHAHKILFEFLKNNNFV